MSNQDQVDKWVEEYTIKRCLFNLASATLGLRDSKKERMLEEFIKRSN